MAQDQYRTCTITPSSRVTPHRILLAKKYQKIDYKVMMVFFFAYSHRQKKRII
jgi:hypothetical protein